MLKTKMVEAGEYTRSCVSLTRSYSSRLGARPSSLLAIVAKSVREPAHGRRRPTEVAPMQSSLNAPALC